VPALQAAYATWMAEGRVSSDALALAARAAGVGAWEASMGERFRQRLRDPAMPGRLYERFVAVLFATIVATLAPAGAAGGGAGPRPSATGATTSVEHLRYITVITVSMALRAWASRGTTYELGPGATVADIEYALSRKRWVPLQLVLTAYAAGLGERPGAGGGPFLAPDVHRPAVALAPAGDGGEAPAPAGDGGEAPAPAGDCEEPIAGVWQVRRVTLVAETRTRVHQESMDLPAGSTLLDLERFCRTRRLTNVRMVLLAAALAQGSPSLAPAWGRSRSPRTHA